MKKRFLIITLFCFVAIFVFIYFNIGKINNSNNSEKTSDNKPVIYEVDWKTYFKGLNGCAVIYDPKNNCYQIYNNKLSTTRRSPCSTFKIVSSLIGMESGAIDLNNSVKEWSGEVFWNSDWNKNLDYIEAFQTSCVWYFRDVIDDIGKERMEKELIELQYGNCDISDWQGKQNTNNNNPVLTGFWIESSLKISPKEQVEVMERIFGDDSQYSDEIIKELEKAMYVDDFQNSNVSVYGKTGMGKDNGVVVDSWFVGFFNTKEKEKIYFSICLGETENEDVSSVRAKEIALDIINDLSM